jgi:hypothetical protein
VETRRWVSIDEVSTEIREEPWSLYWREWKSGTAEFERFLHEPLSVLSEELDGVASDWSVTTQIINHDHGLGMTAVCSLAMVVPENKTALLTIYKHARE